MVGNSRTLGSPLLKTIINDTDVYRFRQRSHTIEEDSHSKSVFLVVL